MDWWLMEGGSQKADMETRSVVFSARKAEGLGEHEQRGRESIELEKGGRWR